MEDPLVRRIAGDPQYQALKAQRSRLGWTLSIAMLVVYYGFILLVAFNKPFLSSRLGDGVMTMGIPVGLGVILFTVAITVYYVRRANNEFDAMTERVTKGALK
jgi:uncharacterized membrane protein (DUF485 family)